MYKIHSLVMLYFFKLVFNFSSIRMCDYNSEHAYSQNQFLIKTDTEYNASNDFPKILIKNNKH